MKNQTICRHPYTNEKRVLKRIAMIMLAMIMLFSCTCASAEETKSGQDLAAGIFRSLTEEYDYSLNYLRHRQALLQTFTEIKNHQFSDESYAKTFFRNSVLNISFDSSFAICSFYLFNQIGDSSVSGDDIYEKMFLPLFELYGRNETGFQKACYTLYQMVFYGDSEKHYGNLEGIKEKIKELNQAFPDYEYNSALKDFYRKCLQMTDYIAGSSDSYMQMKEEISDLEKTKRELRSEFDFDFSWMDIEMDSCYVITDTFAAFYQRAKKLAQSKGFKALGGVFQSERAAVQKDNGKWGFVDTAGRLVIDCVYSKVSSFRHGYAIVTNETGGKGVIDPDGNEIIPIGKYEDVGSFEDGLFRIRQNGKFGYINEKDEIVIQPSYADANYFSEGLASVKADGKIGAINKDGEIVITPRFDSFFVFSEGTAVITEGDRSYYIDQQGNKLFGTDYAKANKFSEGLATCLDAMEKDADGNFPFRVVRANGETVYTLKCQNMGTYRDGLVWYLEGWLLGFLDDKGQQVIAPAYNSINMATDGNAGSGCFAAEKEGKWGIIDRNNNTIIPFEFDKAYPYVDGYCIAIKDDQIYIFDQNRKNVYEQ